MWNSGNYSLKVELSIHNVVLREELKFMPDSLHLIDRSMSANREEILENFMVVTRIKNVEEAIIWLECCNWDLTSAIKTSSPEEVQLQNDAYSRKVRNGSIPEAVNPPGLEEQEGAPSLRVIEVYVVHGASIHLVRAPDNISFHCFKRLVSFVTDIPPCQQVITGWPQQPSSDADVLSFLPKLSYVVLRGSASFMETEVPTEMEEFDEPDSLYHFKVFDEAHDRCYNLKVPGSHTVGQVKLDAYLLTDIPVTCQAWSGWPEGTSDDTQVRFLLLDQPEHSLGIRANQPPHPETALPSSVLVDLSEEVIDLDDTSDIFIAENDVVGGNTFDRPGPPHLIPSNVEDEMAGSVHFIDEYMRRYGQATPSFLTGTLEDALREAFHRPVREKRMLALYVHHDGSILSNVFCTELLGSEATHQILANYFVVWGWDVTNETSRGMLTSSVIRVLGSSFARTVDMIPTDSFPALFVIAPIRSQYELLNVIYGNNGITEMLSSLVAAVEIFTKNMEVEAIEEDERNARQKIKNEQDSAYEESLVMDRAKDEAKRQKILEKTKEEERVKRELELEDKRRLAEVAVVRSNMPPEPPQEDNRSVYTFKFRAPSGDTFGRRFYSTDTLVVVFNFLFVNGYDVQTFKFITGWPRKDLTLMNPQTVLGDLGIFHQETIILEAR
ncbi:FAS-associated factor 1 isoform X2 [Halyomorpha halys]|uniref:FAS-associated factor 1 isoform X2 n=1 Tax=Halyomorpha halys TaxID=286706 RepID=UPI000D0C8772|nr:FAS-associated factor 1-like isoform X1 [Halyomorpha halys]